MDEKEINRYKKFGNNYFTLKAPNKKTLCGVLTELPQFSFSTSWNASPQSAMAEQLLKMVNKPEFEFLAAKGNNARAMRRFGNTTTKVYENAEPVSFELKFRCYPGQPFGNDTELSTVVEWLDSLKESVIGNNAAISLDSIITTFKNAAKGGVSSVLGIIDEFKELGQSDDEGKLVENGYYSKSLHKRYARGYAKDINMQLKFDHLAVNNAKNNFGRIRNSIENYGAALYSLRLYPFMFNSSFTVYISSWSMKPSKEFNLSENDNYYFDFSIECTMDQIPSASVWDTMLAWKD